MASERETIRAVDCELSFLDERLTELLADHARGSLDGFTSAEVLDLIRTADRHVKKARSILSRPTGGSP